MTREAEHLLVAVAAGGWFMVKVGTKEPFFVRFERNDAGRLKPIELYLTGSPISPTALRGLPLARVEAFVNGPGRGSDFEELIASLEASGPNPRALLEQAAWVLPGDHRQAPPVQAPVDFRLPVIPEGRKPDDFYRQVAEVYSTVAGWTSRPGPEIAEANSVPVTTVHRWVKRARELGFLGPGQKGRREQGEQQTAATDSGIGRPIRRHYDVPREDPIGVPETWPPPVEEPADEAEAQPVIGQKGRRG